MKFTRSALLAAAASALMLDDKSTTRSAEDKPKPADDIADGSQLPDPNKDKPEGEFPVDDGTGDGTSNQPDPDDKDGDKAALVAFGAEQQAKGRAEMHSRIQVVFASEHVVGREAAAAELLAADLDAPRVLALIEKLPKGASTAMLDALKVGNPELDAGSESTVDTRKASADVWDKAHAAAGIGKK